MLRSSSPTLAPRRTAAKSIFRLGLLAGAALAMTTSLSACGGQAEETAPTSGDHEGVGAARQADDSPSPVVMTSAWVKASDGGSWKAYSPCGWFHLSVLDGVDPTSANILNQADGSLSLSLTDGTHTFGLLGTDGNTPGSTHTIDVTFGDTTLTIDQTSGSAASAVVGDKLVTISGFGFKIPSDAGYSSLDRVAVCSVNADGYADSYGAFTVTVASAPPPVVMTSALVAASDGGEWKAYSPCGFFHLSVLDGVDPTSANILNQADGSLSLPLTDGTRTFGLLGTDGNTPGSTHTMNVTFGDTTLTIDQTSGSTASAVVGDKLVTISGFGFKIPSDDGYSSLDRVAVCSVNADGYPDSYGAFTVTVAAAPPPVPVVMTNAVVAASDGGAWEAYSPCGFFHLYVLDGVDPTSANVLNQADDSLSLPLTDGTHTFGLLGTDGNTPGSTHTIHVAFGDTTLTVDQTSGSTASAVVGGKVVTISGFGFTIPSDTGYSSLDRVAVCSVNADGYPDSYGAVTVTVATAP